GARLQPPDGPAQAHRPGRVGRAACDCGVFVPGARRPPLRAPPDPARQGRSGGAGPEEWQGVLQLERLRRFPMPQALNSPLSAQGPAQILGPAVCVATAVWSAAPVFPGWSSLYSMDARPGVGLAATPSSSY